MAFKRSLFLILHVRADLHGSALRVKRYLGYQLGGPNLKCVWMDTETEGLVTLWLDTSCESCDWRTGARKKKSGRFSELGFFTSDQLR